MQFLNRRQEFFFSIAFFDLIRFKSVLEFQNFLRVNVAYHLVYVCDILHATFGFGFLANCYLFNKHCLSLFLKTLLSCVLWDALISW